MSTPNDREAFIKSFEISRAKLYVWDRKDEELNKLIWDDLETMINNTIHNALTNRNYEAYTFLTELKQSIFVKHLEKIKKEVQIGIEWEKSQRK